MEKINDKSLSLDESLYRWYHAFNDMYSQPNDYGCGVLLYASEIHMIEAIEVHKDTKTTDLAEILGMTKGTVSKMTNSLAKKGFIKKYQYTDNKKEIYYILTELGIKAFEGHKKYHEIRNHDIYDEFEGYNKEQQQFLLDFIDKHTHYLENFVIKNSTKEK